jgi:hypothetical protein
MTPLLLVLHPETERLMGRSPDTAPSDRRMTGNPDRPCVVSPAVISLFLASHSTASWYFIFVPIAFLVVINVLRFRRGGGRGPFRGGPFGGGGGPFRGGGGPFGGGGGTSRGGGGMSGGQNT